MLLPTANLHTFLHDLTPPPPSVNLLQWGSEPYGPLAQVPHSTHYTSDIDPIRHTADQQVMVMAVA